APEPIHDRRDRDLDPRQHRERALRDRYEPGEPDMRRGGIRAADAVQHLTVSGDRHTTPVADAAPPSTPSHSTMLAHSHPTRLSHSPDGRSRAPAHSSAPRPPVARA